MSSRLIVEVMMFLGNIGKNNSSKQADTEQKEERLKLIPSGGQPAPPGCWLDCRHTARGKSARTRRKNVRRRGGKLVLTSTTPPPPGWPLITTEDEEGRFWAAGWPAFLSALT